MLEVLRSEASKASYLSPSLGRSSLILTFANCPIQNIPHIRFRSSDDEENFLRDSARQCRDASQQAQPEYLDRPFFQTNTSGGVHPPILRSFGFLAA
jgi:hypothetical protein